MSDIVILSFFEDEQQQRHDFDARHDARAIGPDFFMG